MCQRWLVGCGDIAGFDYMSAAFWRGGCGGLGAAPTGRWGWSSCAAPLRVWSSSPRGGEVGARLATMIYLERMSRLLLAVVFLLLAG